MRLLMTVGRGSVSDSVLVDYREQHYNTIMQYYLEANYGMRRSLLHTPPREDCGSC